MNKIKRKIDGLFLYESAHCPYCMIVRRAINHLGLSIPSRDTNKTENWQELQKLGGKSQVPCLRIEKDGETHWLYESSDIIHYIDKHYGEATWAEPVSDEKMPIRSSAKSSK